MKKDWSIKDLIKKIKIKFDWRIDPTQLGMQFMAFILRFFQNSLLWAFLGMIALWYAAYRIFHTNEQVPVLAAISTSLVVMFGYFATHYFQSVRDQREKKLQRYLDLVKTLRFFIVETDLNLEQRSKIRDELQDAYFAFSLLTSAKSYAALSNLMKKFENYLNNKTENNLIDFKNSQSDFVNSLRNELFKDSKIKFETYDFILSKERYSKGERIK